MKRSDMRRLALAFLVIILSHSSFAQLTVNPNQTALVLATKLAGPGITISSPVLTCTGVANGTFVSTSTPITIDSGILLTSGKAVNTIGPESILASTSNGTPGDPSLAALAMATTYDACALEFDFIPNGDTVTFNYQFGSEEYINSTCGPYNDAFAFFISGPGITGSQNMALVPGTTIPITVNSVNSGVPGPGYPLSNCTVMGPGSPFTAYYYNNFGGTQLTYRGFTRKMAAVHDVIPCSSYHLKMAVCDAGNRLYDSGVFIEAGSLKTNSLSFDRTLLPGATINGIPNAIVKGCTPATIRVNSSRTLGTAKTVHFAYGGTAIRDTDYTTVDSAIIAAGTDSVFINIPGLPTIPAGVKTLKVYIVSTTCGILDSITINILDTPSAALLTPDTTICSGVSFTLRTTGTAGLSYSWSPATGLSSASTPLPVATPMVSTVYSMTATLPGSGCPPIVKAVSITVIDATVALATRDTTICEGSVINIDGTGSSSMIYNWTPPTGLSNPAIINPVASPTVTTTYTMTATSPGGECTAGAVLTITVGNPVVQINTADTSICRGASVFLNVSGDSSLIYTWTPSVGLSDAEVKAPVASPGMSTTYVVTARYPGAPCFVMDSLSIAVTSATLADITPNQIIKYGSSIQLNSWGAIFYAWSPDNGSLSNPNINNPMVTPLEPTTYTVTTIDKNGCKSSASVTIDIYYDTVGIPGAFTPNGDGLNDVFRVENLGFYKVVEMRIFNRWGNEVYHVMGQNKGWDGTFYGARQDAGVYNYQIMINDAKGVLHDFKGTVTLLR